jgi:RHS repeat-associated protein
MPSGELFAEQRDHWATPYKFNGKELDEETGYYYYGARYYTPELGVWLSVDPLADKYPSMSAFMYCAGNPVVLVDPDGREIWIVGSDGSSHQYGTKDKNGNSVKYGGSDPFIIATEAALDKISEYSSGGEMVSELSGPGNMFTIEGGQRSSFIPTDKSKAYLAELTDNPKHKASYEAMKAAGVDLSGGSGGNIVWNPTQKVKTTKGERADGVVNLAHELFHGLDANRGKMSDQLEGGLERNEWQATFRENVLRDEMRLPLRTSYGNVKVLNRTEGGWGTTSCPSWYKPDK